MLSKHTVIEWFDERVVLLNAQNGRVFELNPTAALMWDKLQTNPSLAAEFLVKNGYSHDEAVGLIGEFVDHLLDAGLVEK
ncbi:PqqD family protein [Microvenator marinus]|uniref:PqqD family protein n=1 Tax=Microvenator marinus TaxID=2600177 RepID=UPI00201B82B7|nr:PqqD family protein [Microvenator marinus]